MNKIKRALLIIDMQESYFKRANGKIYNVENLVSQINERIARALEEMLLLIYIKNIGSRIKKNNASEFVEGLSIRSENVLFKDTVSAFSNKILSELLEINRIKEVETIGIDGNCCVAATAIDAAKAGYSVFYPFNYIGMKHPEHFLKTREKLLEQKVSILGYSDYFS